MDREREKWFKVYVMILQYRPLLNGSFLLHTLQHGEHISNASSMDHKINNTFTYFTNLSSSLLTENRQLMTAWYALIYITSQSPTDTHSLIHSLSKPCKNTALPTSLADGFLNFILLYTEKLDHLGNLITKMKKKGQFFFIWAILLGPKWGEMKPCWKCLLYWYVVVIGRKYKTY